MAKEKDVKKNKNAKNKDNKKVKKNKEKFSVGLKRELKQIKWPTFKEIVKYTIATIIFVIVLVALFGLLKFGMSLIMGN